MFFKILIPALIIAAILAVIVMYTAPIWSKWLKSISNDLKSAWSKAEENLTNRNEDKGD